MSDPYQHLDAVKKILRKRIVNEWFDLTEEGKQEKLVVVEHNTRLKLSEKDNGVWFVVEGCGEYGSGYDGSSGIETIGGDTVAKPIFVQFKGRKNERHSFVADHSKLRLYHIPDLHVWYENEKLKQILKQ